MAKATASISSEETKKAGNPRTPTFRVSFEKYWKPEISKGKEKDTGRDIIKTTYSLSALIPKSEDISEMWEVARVSLKKMFPEAKSDGGEWFDGFAEPIRDGDTDKSYKNREECKGMWVVAMRCAVGHYEDDGKEAYGRKPELRLNNAAKTPITETTVVGGKTFKGKDLFYSGAYASASYGSYAYKSDKKKGGSISVINILMMKHGERLAASYSADQDFAEVPSTEDWDVDNSACLSEDDEEQ